MPEEALWMMYFKIQWSDRGTNREGSSWSLTSQYTFSYQMPEDSRCSQLGFKVEISRQEFYTLSSCHIFVKQISKVSGSRALVFIFWESLPGWRSYVYEDRQSNISGIKCKRNANIMKFLKEKKHENNLITSQIWNPRSHHRKLNGEDNKIVNKYWFCGESIEIV